MESNRQRSELAKPHARSFSVVIGIRSSRPISSPSFGGQPAPLIIVESHSPVADLLSQNTIFFNQVFDNLLLALIHPTGNRDDKKRKWIQTRAHPGRLPRTKTPMSLKTEHNRVFVHYGQIPHRPEKAGVGGSIPSLGTFPFQLHLELGVGEEGS
jgi:hypothetical protein